MLLSDLVRVADGKDKLTHLKPSSATFYICFKWTEEQW